jgi:hypothetical protein
MNLEEMDPLAMVSVEDAKRELMKHGFPSYIEGGFSWCYMYAEVEVVLPCGHTEIEESRVCRVHDTGDVYSSELLEWLELSR